MNKKEYAAPEIKVSPLAEDDVITISLPHGNDEETPIF